jgi:protein translocase SEC61 complex gamma subunit
MSELKKSISGMKRVWKVTKKPTKKDYFTTVKIVAVGLLVIGLIGFIVFLLDQFIIAKLFN